LHQKKFKPLNICLINTEKKRIILKNIHKKPSVTSQPTVGSWGMGDRQSRCYRLKVSQLFQFTSKQRSQYCQSKTLSILFPAWHHKSSWKQWILLIPPIYSCFKATVFSTMFSTFIIIFILTLCYLVTWYWDP